MKAINTISVFSGGLDSSVMVAYLKEQGYNQLLLSFDYKQKHRKELESAAKIAKYYGLPHRILDVSSVNSLLKGSSLTDTQNVPVPEGHYEHETMAKTIVPGRNAMMLSIAWAIAASDINIINVATAVHAGDHAIYPDCRPEFIRALENGLRHGTMGVANLTLSLFAPFLLKSKADIVKLGLDLKVPFELTWSCYNGGEVSDGLCSTCVERLESFAANGAEDPLPYLDKTSWKKVVDDFNKAKEATMEV